MSEDIGLFYGSTTGMTESVAYRMREFAMELSLELTPVNIADLDNPADMFLHDKLIIGSPTWNYGEHQDDWEIILPKLVDVNLTGKKIALFGLGDQLGYPEYYVDAMGLIWQQFKSQGAEFIGSWSTDGYEFTESKALVDDSHFVGLVLDEDCQPELTNSRIKTWLAQIIAEFAK